MQCLFAKCKDNVNVVILTINLMITVQIFKKIMATIILRNSDNIRMKKAD